MNNEQIAGQLLKMARNLVADRDVDVLKSALKAAKIRLTESRGRSEHLGFIKATRKINMAIRSVDDALNRIA